MPIAELILVFGLQFSSWYYRQNEILNFDFILRIYWYVGVGCSGVYMVMNVFYLIRNYGCKSYEEDD